MNDETEQTLVEIPKTINPSLELPDPDLLNYYKDLDDRIIWMLGSIEDDACWAWARRIIDFNRQDQKIPIKDRRPIRIIIDNLGGSLPAAWMLIEIIEMSKTPIYTICIGDCASAASLIFLAGHKRYATKNSVFLFHHGSLNSLNGTSDEVSKFMDVYNKNIEDMDTFYAKHTKFKLSYIRKQLKEGDWYIPANEALENNVFNEYLKNLDILM